MNTGTALAGTAAALIIATTGLVVGSSVESSSTETVTVVSTPTPPGCNDWAVSLTTGECQAAGIIRYVMFHNLQGASQFCKWRSANPGEWTRLKAYAGSNVQPTSIVTWFGGAIKNDLEAYFATGAPPMTYTLANGTTVAGIQPNTAPNACSGQTLSPPAVSGVTPGQTDATVTIETGP